VKIYLTGAADFKNGTIINAGQPTGFSIFSNSSQPIKLYNSGDFAGLVYAPFAFVDVANSGGLYGVVWANTVQVNNSGSVFIDIDVLNSFLIKKIQIASWKLDRG
jgi:hypothetical protein